MTSSAIRHEGVGVGYKWPLFGYRRGTLRTMTEQRTIVCIQIQQQGVCHQCQCPTLVPCLSLVCPLFVLPSRDRPRHPGKLSHMFLHELNPLLDNRTNHQFILSAFEFTLSRPLKSEDFLVFLAACQTKHLSSQGTRRNYQNSQEQRTPERAPLACLGRGRPFGGFDSED